MAIPNAPEPPLVVTDQTMTSAILTAFRYVLTAIGGALVTRGAITEDTLQLVLGIVGAVGPNVIGVFLSIRNKKRLIRATIAAPDEAAVLVSRNIPH